jgi:hypothetical protein
MDVVSGIVGLAKVAAQAAGVPVDQADAATIAARRDFCRDCPHASKNPKYADRPSKGLTRASRCDLCKCNIAAKTRIASQKCPLGKW